MNTTRAAGRRKDVPPMIVVFKNSFKGFSPVRFGLERSKIRENVRAFACGLPVGLKAPGRPRGNIQILFQMLPGKSCCRSIVER
jgi:hypothetical protein